MGDSGILGNNIGWIFSEGHVGYAGGWWDDLVNLVRFTVLDDLVNLLDFEGLMVGIAMGVGSPGDFW